MATTLAERTAGPVAAGLELDLGAEADRFFRERMAVAGTGFGVGTVFVGLGAYALGLFARRGLSPELLVAALLMVLGVAVIILCFQSGLINPVRAIRADATGLTYVRRWRGTVRRSWTAPGVLLEVDDLGPDPMTPPEGKLHLFFAGPGPVYGNLARTDLGPLLDAVRARGLEVRMKEIEGRSGRTQHRIRRIRISRPAAD